MHNSNFIVREPLLDPKQRVIGYDFAWQDTGNNSAEHKEAEAGALLTFVAEHLVSEKSGWLLGDKVLFMETVPGQLDSEAMKKLPPKHTVLTLNSSDLAEPETLAAVRALHTRGFGIALRGADVSDENLLSEATHVEVQFSADDFAAQARRYAALKKSAVRMVGRPVTTWPDYDACATLGLDAFVGKLHLTPRPGNTAKGLNPTQRTIVLIMDMVTRNDDIQDIENAFKRDPALSYKVLCFINSAAFGLKNEVQSLRAALSLLGYKALFQWLSLLLANASSSGYSPVLMETAIIRGRFSELLGQDHLPKGEAENLFVVGIFSLLDRLLGITMAEVLETIQLSDEVKQALLTRDGPYGAYLALAEACELNSMLVGPLSASLKISPEELNVAHLSALSWAQNIGI
ncbi:EAL and HDOD domain-containing protein [Paraherbaspirillum soli]|uniref:EAL and HDOD domain-containing protein n=1 Tax=Paraherbaspirillum soli TaxID=631222 RepID=A0ABW0M9S3_9BURK